MTHDTKGVPGAFVHPVVHEDVIAGNGTIGLEILEELEEVDAVVVPYGGGGLSCGIASAIKARSSWIPSPCRDSWPTHNLKPLYSGGLCEPVI